MQLESVAEKVEKKVDRHLDRFVDKKIGERVKKLNSIGSFLDEEEDDDVEIHEGDKDYEDHQTELDKVNLAKVSVDEATSAINKEDVADIFIDIGESYMAKGEVVSYTVIDNSTKAQLGTEYHPFSYDELKAKYGGGHFKIIARHKGKYIRTDVKYLAGAKKNFNAEEKVEKAVQPQNSVDVDSIINKMSELTEKNAMALMRTQEEARKREMELQKEMRETISKSEQSNTTLIEKVLLAQSNQKNGLAEALTAIAPYLVPVLPKLLAPKETKNDSVDMMMKIQEMNMKMMEKMNESNQKMFETLQKQIEKIADKKSDSKDGMSAFEMMKMMKDAESEGFEKMKMIRELAKEEAEERAYLRGERDDDEPKEKASAVDTLITTLTPMLAGKMLGGGAQPSFTPPSRPVIAKNPQVLPSNNLQRGSVSGVQRNANTPSGVKGTTIQATPKREEARVSPQGKTGSGISSINPVKAPSVFDTLKTLPEPEVKVEAPKVQEATAQEISIQEVSNHAVNVSSEEREANIEMVKGIVFPIIIAKSMDESATISGVSDECVEALLNSGLQASDIVRDFDEVAISAIINELPDSYHEMIKDLHNAIIQKLKNRIG